MVGLRGLLGTVPGNVAEDNSDISGTGMERKSAVEITTRWQLHRGFDMSGREVLRQFFVSLVRNRCEERLHGFSIIGRLRVPAD